MKPKCLLAILAFSFGSSFLTTAKAQTVSASDSLALVDLYNSTNGSSWTRHQNWLTTKPVNKWFGVTVTDSRITVLTLQGNNLSGTLPVSIGNLTALTQLYLGSNRISGSLPVSIGSLTALTTLQAYRNQLSGSIPLTIGYAAQLVSLDLSDNELSGTLTDSITRLSKLSELKLNNNQLSGSLPYAIGNLTALINLQLHDNSFTGSLPASFTSLKNLVTFDASFNKLSGSLPSDIGAMDSLQIFYVGVNQLTGSIPSSIGNISNLQNLDLSSNQFTGSIPGSLSKLSQLQDAELGYNKLSGSIPPSLGNLGQLFILALNNNQLSGTIPPSLGKLQSLSELNVSSNQLTGSLPPAVLKIPHLNFLEAYFNQLTDAGNLSNAQLSLPNLTLKIGYNRFTFNTLQYVAGNIPRATYSPQALLSIHQRGNKLAVFAGGTLSKNTYTWYLVGQSASTSITGDSTFKPAASGAYYATITNNIATDVTLTTDTVTYTVSPLANNEVPMKLSVYPNPARNSIVINGITGTGTSHITITDISGAVWSTAVAAPDASVKSDVSRLKPGNYTLHITNGSGTASVGFVKE